MRFGKSIITKVFDIYGYDRDTGKLVFTSKNLTKGGVKNSQSSEEVRNGENNTLWTILYSDKTTEVSCTENTFNFDELAMLAGTSVTTGAEDVYTDEQTFTISGEATTITLSDKPKTGAVINCAINGELKEASATGTTLTVTGAKAGDVVTVYPYLIEGEATTETISINMDDNPKGMILIAKTKELSSDHKVVGDIEFVFPNAITTGEWNIDTTSKVQANEQEITFKILQIEGSKNIYKIHRIPKATA